MAALFAGHLAGAGDLLEVSRAARALPAPPGPPRPIDLLLDGLTAVVTDGRAAAAPALRQRQAPSPAPDIPVEERSGGAGWPRRAASALWDDDAWRAMLGAAGPARP